MAGHGVVRMLECVSRWIRSGEARRRSSRDRRVRRSQRSALRTAYDRSASRLIAFVVPGADPQTGTENLWGGVLSICRICDEMQLVAPAHGSDVILCTIPGETPFVRHTLFPSEMDVYRLEQVFDYFTSLRSLTLHIPEYASAEFVSLLDGQQRRWFAEIEHVHVNVMNQNIDFMPAPESLDGLRSISSLLTMTTAHRMYCTEELSNRYRMPVHHLAVPIGADQYRQRSLAEKEPLVLFSPDDRAKNGEVARLLADHVSGLEMVEIRGMPYREYRSLLERARWLFTFGEGLDYYFVESVFSGGISFAVFNDRFFTPEFGRLDTVYASFEDLCDRLVADFERLSEPEAYEACRQAQLAVVSGIYSLRQFRDNLERFLRGNYTWQYSEAARAHQ